jgi:hypothetical protein
MTNRAHRKTTPHRAALAICAISACVFMALPAHATVGSHHGVTISSKPTKHMSFSNGLYIAITDNAVLNVTDLTNALDAGSVTVTTGSNSGGDEKGDMHIEAGFTWAAKSALTLQVYHSIFVDQAIVDAGAGAMSLSGVSGRSIGTATACPVAARTREPMSINLCGLG